MKRPFAQRGESNVGCIIWALALAVLIVILWKVVPAKVANARLADYVDEQATHGRRLSEQKLAQRILRKAEELELPLSRKQLEIRKSRDHVTVRYEYTLPLEFPGYTYPMKFEYQVERDYFY
jgi:hypothetical protein